ncbi:hypothetical protein I3843_15G014600 [Carya illinoinensis]|uniref:Uncharacterized protein n=1 Tax=Carya illinoinensis TaxID=32201 RepID=A0A922D9Z2_CARIL|nr:hypothetical protein I3760_15G015000 [Carya illinoinensis]KAG6673930.1 hypothetical protein I3842_15G015700 [Carya illinoinensis]KAG7942968.1 hypothetical protein I3843_15G014600 [Carya illinoinensis]
MSIIYILFLSYFKRALCDKPLHPACPPAPDPAPLALVGHGWWTNGIGRANL